MSIIFGLYCHGKRKALLSLTALYLGTSGGIPPTANRHLDATIRNIHVNLSSITDTIEYVLELLFSGFPRYLPDSGQGSLDR